MEVKFSVYDFKDIMKICGSVTATTEKDKPRCQYIDLYFDPADHSCTACGCNGYQLSTVKVRCEYRDIPFDYHLLIPPMKVVPRTKTVKINIDEDGYSVAFIDEDEDILKAVSSPFTDVEPMDYKALISSMRTHIEKYNHGEGAYCICVNPRYLITALESLKSCDSVYLNFSDRVHAFTVRPGDDSVAAEAFILPVRHA